MYYACKKLTHTIYLALRNWWTEKVQAFADKSGIPIVGEIPRSDEIIRWEDQGKTVIEGDAKSSISRRFFDLAEMLLKAEEEEWAELIIVQ